MSRASHTARYPSSERLGEMESSGRRIKMAMAKISTKSHRPGRVSRAITVRAAATKHTHAAMVRATYR